MKCFLTVVKNIVALAIIIVVASAGVGLLGLATALTVYLLGLGPQSAWPLAIFASYFVLCVGTIAGIVECRG
jgi:hypothetical protein